MGVYELAQMQSSFPGKTIKTELDGKEYNNILHSNIERVTDISHFFT